MTIDTKILRESALAIAEAMELDALAIVAVDPDGSSLVILSNNKSPQQAQALAVLSRHMTEGAQQATGQGEAPEPDEGPSSAN